MLFRSFKISYVKGGFKSGYTNISKLSNCVNVFKNFDIIHLHSFNPILALAAVLAKKKIVFTEHGNFGFEREKRFFEKLVKSFQGYFLRNFPNAILFNSNFTKSVAQNSYRLADKNTYVVYNGIEVPNNVETEVKYDLNNTYKIGFVGRLVEVKRIDRLIEVIHQLPDKTKICVEIIGDGPLKNQLATKIQQLHLDKQFVFLGYQNNIQAYYSNWDLLIAPSSNEAFGLVAIEAYSYGCPVAVFSDGGGLAELVNQCEPAQVFASVESMCKFLSDCMESSGQLNETNRRNHRKAFASTFSIEKMEESIKQVYLSL